MKREDKEKLEKELSDIINIIIVERDKAKDIPEYKNTEEKILKMQNSIKADFSECVNLKNIIYKRYTVYNYSCFGYKLNNIKPSVKQGIKVGLGMKNIESIKGNILKIVREMIDEDLKSPKIKIIEQKLFKVNEKIKELREHQQELINKNIEVFKKKRAKIYGELYFAKPISKKLKKQIREVENKMKTLPTYLPKIRQEINKRLILDEINK